MTSFLEYLEEMAKIRYAVVDKDNHAHFITDGHTDEDYKSAKRVAAKHPGSIVTKIFAKKDRDFTPIKLVKEDALEEAAQTTLSAKELEAKIGKTRFKALTKHSFYERFAKGTYLQPTRYTHYNDGIKHVVQASNDGQAMVQFHMHNINHRVSNAFLYKWEGHKDSAGRKVWHQISSVQERGINIT